MLRTRALSGTPRSGLPHGLRRSRVLRWPVVGATLLLAKGGSYTRLGTLDEQLEIDGGDNCCHRHAPAQFVGRAIATACSASWPVKPAFRRIRSNQQF